MKQTLICAATAVVFFACSKSSGVPSTPQTSASITGKWMVSRLSDTIFAPIYNVANIPGDPGEYMDFKADGKLYCYDWYEGGIAKEYAYDTLTYSVSGSWVIISNKKGWTDSATVMQTSANTVTLYFKGLSGYPQERLWDYLKK